MSKKATVIALSGKGGVGKTSLSASMVRVLTEEKPDARILAIDADPAVGLSVALGIEVKETLDEVRLRVAEEVTEGMNETQDILAEAKYHLVDALNEDKGFAFLAIGRPEAAGCYCAINTYLRQVISILADEFDYVVIDGEAGIEQVNRRVMEKVTHLVLVSDQSRKGIEIIKTINKVSQELVMAEKTGVVFNRVMHPDMVRPEELDGIPVISVIEPDEALALNDIEGMSVLELPGDCRILEGARKALKELGII